MFDFQAGGQWVKIRVHMVLGNLTQCWGGCSGLGVQGEVILPVAS